jgi:putative effector of murein hydrolase LrgA (UPF0299 family)
VKQLCRLLAVILLFLYAGAAVADTAQAPPGFWSGFLDGFMSLLKLLASPVVEVSLVNEGANALAYDAGYYAGVLTFSASAAAAASPADPEAQWE